MLKNTLVGAQAERLLLGLRPDVEKYGLCLGVATAGEPDAVPAGPGEERLLRDMLPVRRREFTAGRCAARRALARAGIPAGEILSEGRRPRMPAGSVGSITHCADTAVAVAAPRQRYRCLGVDLELRPLPSEAARLVLCQDERAWMNDTAGDAAESERRLLAAFSAKEAAFKAFSVLLPPGEAPTMLLGIALDPTPSGFRTRPRRLPGPVLDVMVHPVGPGVLSWTAVPHDACTPPAGLSR
ncbi:4'-phosphopantetheinyl transferase superfamily protein [Streptomyces sp. NK08204]|uniref:4'-phosphopantetheinyl transferase superfamily protein n=1 Tax=Streptomyces sp. NK08204 TaxID=2873260 RepID=UPI001CEDA1CD|nr:4'-phosphopantetheinyl transferase superfamily protein [Streptomyces sp. NK08204]